MSKAAQVSRRCHGRSREFGTALDPRCARANMVAEERARAEGKSMATRSTCAMRWESKAGAQAKDRERKREPSPPSNEGRAHTQREAGEALNA